MSTRDRCKTPDSPEGARQITTSPSQSSSPPLRINSPTNNNNNGTGDSLTPPPPPPPPSQSHPAATALSLTLDSPRSFNDLPYFGPPGGRQLTKVKKFLSTLVQFGNDLNSDVGERVKSLVLNLVSSNLTIEEFHHSLQDVTNFPLRPFVLPFLRTHMPLLQREVQALARLSKQSALQYIRNHDHVIFEPAHSPSEPSEIFMANDGGGGVKRRSPDGSYENGDNDISPAKRPAFLNPHQQGLFLPTAPTTFFDCHQPSMKNDDHPSGGRGGDEEWRNIHVMLNCILSMVEKTKRALAILQTRNSSSSPDGGGVSDWLRKQDVGQDLKKVANEIISTAIRAAEERVGEVRRRAEEAVGDVKRQAVIELQRAVAAAEARAGELLTAERVRVDGRKLPSTEDSGSDYPDQSTTNACWNCGRKAHETCSGCSVARYCGPFCQHKDWENHHQVCAKDKRPNPPLVAAAPTTPPTKK